MAKKRSYTPMPEVPQELQERYRVVLQVNSGELSVSEGARRLGMSRNHFQSLVHKGLEAMIEGLTPKPAGRPAKAPEQQELERELDRLRRENERLRHRVENFDRALGVAAEVFNRRINSVMQATRQKHSTTKSTASDENEDDEPGALLRANAALRDSGVPKGLRAAVTGVSTSTLDRWRSRKRSGLAPRARPGPQQHNPPGPETIQQASALVRELRGLVGAESLSHSVEGLSRRRAATIKRTVLREMERERVECATRVEIGVPGVMRGMDAMHITTTEQWRWILIFADAAVPFRTSIKVLERYDEDEIATAVELDFAQHGAPLVLRCDRWKAHRTPAVVHVVRKHGVVLLSGPAHHPCFYGQLERQNREHRAWLQASAPVRSADLQAQTDVMTGALNGLW
jgi:transposase-like protein